MRNFLIKIPPYLLALISAAILSSIFASFFVHNALADIGVQLSLKERVVNSAIDLGILQTTAPIIAVAFAIGFLVAAWISKNPSPLRLKWFLAAGFLSWVAALLILAAIFGLTPIAGTRGWLALTMQGVAGALGGYVFHSLTREK